MIKKIKAGALQYVIFISIIIAIILSSFILLIHLNKKVKYKNQKFQELIFNTNNAIDYAKQKNVFIGDSIIISSKDNLTSTKITSTPWGIFNKVNVISSFKNQEFQKIAFLGGFKKQKPALYLQNVNKPLVLVGETEIIGKTYLPSQGVKRGNIAGNSYSGSQLIYGNRLSSRQHLPSLEHRTYLQNLCKGIITTDLDAFILEKSNFEITQYTNSFREKTKHYKRNTIIDLQHIEISGNYIIQSDTLIRVHNTSKLKDVILIAPYIDVQERTKGNFQAFATKGITIKQNCLLTYPTVLVLAEVAKNDSAIRETQNHQINIEPNSEIKGTVCFFTDNLKTNHQTQINIQENVLITGEVYSEKNIALSGIVNGSIYTHGFLTNAYGSIYHNHIYNGKINSNNVPIQFSGIAFKNEEKNVVQWVY